MEAGESKEYRMSIKPNDKVKLSLMSTNLNSIKGFISFD
jgi:hypothetical protein